MTTHKRAISHGLKKVLQSSRPSSPFEKGLALAVFATVLLLILFRAYTSIFTVSIRFATIIPTFGNIAAYLIALTLLLVIKNPISRMAYFAWLVWFIFGFLNMIGNVYGGRYVASENAILWPTETANYIHIAFVFCFGLGLALTEVQLFSSKHRAARSSMPEAGAVSRALIPVSPLAHVFFLLFPLAYLLTVMIALKGQLPLFSGRDITATLYDYYYGPLYPLQAWVIVCMIFLYVESMRGGAQKNWIHYLAILACLPIAIIDGKRRTIITFIVAALMATAITGSAPKGRARRILILVSGLFAAAILIAVFRSATDPNNVSALRYIAFVGDEYGDFVKSINLFSRATVLEQGYDLWGSTIAELLNRNVLEALGYDKNELVLRDSGTVWLTLFHTNVGIRTGIVSEVWFAHGVVGAPIMAGFGLLFGFLSKRLCSARTILSVVFYLAVLTPLFLCFNGQLSIIIGSITTTLYLWIAMHLESLVAKKSTVPQLNLLNK